MKRIAVGVLAATLAAGFVVGTAGPRGGGLPAASAAPAPMPTSSSSPTPSPSAASTAASTPRPVCPTRTRRPFPARQITIPGVVRRATVVTPPRDGRVPGAPPLTSSGKWQFAWDKKWPIWPGQTFGNVLFNAHVWPDGSAVGNVMLARLHKGDRIVVHGKTKKLCYRVVERVQVYPSQALRRYYRVSGKPRVAIVVCSGRRLGPGIWEKRTIWFAAPMR